MTAQLTTTAFNWLHQYASSLDHMAVCYSELAVSSLAVVEIITSPVLNALTHSEMVRLSWPAWLA